MFQFLYSARNPQGKQVTDYVKAPDLKTARVILESAGFTGIVFHDDETIAAMRKSEVKSKLYPEIELAVRKQKISSTLWMKILKEYWAIPLFLFCLIFYLIHQGISQVNRWVMIGAGIILFLLFVFLFTIFVIFLRVKIYAAIIHAYAWGEWDKMQRRSRILRVILKPFSRKSVISIIRDLDYREAVFLAVHGGLDDALALFKKYESCEHTPKILYYLNVANLFQKAGEYEIMNAFYEKALEEDPGSLACSIDFAIARILYFHDIEGGRQLLKIMENAEIPDLMEPYIDYCYALIAMEEKSWDKAIAGLNRTLELNKPYSSLNPGLSLIGETYLAICLAEIGQKERAQELYNKILPMLEAYKDDDLIKRFEEAMKV